MPVQPRQHEDDIVAHKVKRRVAQKVMRDIHQQVDDIDQQVAIERRARWYLVPLLLIVVFIAAGMLLWPGILRVLSALVNAA